MHAVKINLSNLKRKNKGIEMWYFQIDVCILNASLSLKDFLIHFLFCFVIVKHVNANIKTFYICLFFFFHWKITNTLLILVFITPQEYLI